MLEIEGNNLELPVLGSKLRFRSPNSELLFWSWEVRIKHLHSLEVVRMEDV